MQIEATIECRFFEHITFSGDSVDSEYDDDRPSPEALESMNEDFRQVVQKLVDRPNWGPIDWVEVSIGEDNDDWVDDTLIEYYFRVFRCFEETEIVPDSSYTELTEEARQNLEQEIMDVLGQSNWPQNMTIDVS